MPKVNNNSYLVFSPYEKKVFKSNSYSEALIIKRSLKGGCIEAHKKSRLDKNYSLMCSIYNQLSITKTIELAASNNIHFVNKTQPGYVHVFLSCWNEQKEGTNELNWKLSCKQNEALNKKECLAMNNWDMARGGLISLLWLFDLLDDLEMENVAIHLTHNYAFLCVTKFIHKWASNNWKTVDAQDVKNKDILLLICDVIKMKNWSFHKEAYLHTK